MSATNLISLVQRSTADNIINGSEVQSIIEQASADGVITDGEKKLLRLLLSENTNSLTEQGRELLEQFLEDYSDAGDQQVTSPQAALDILTKNFSMAAKGDGNISRADLQAIVDSPASSEQLKQAARWLLNDFNAFSNLAGIRGDDKTRPADGRISLRDLQVAQQYAGMTRLEAYETLHKYWNRVDTAGGTAERNDLANVHNLSELVRDPNAPEALKAACRLLMNDEEAFKILDGGHNGIERGRFSLKDLNASIAREKTSNRQVISELIRKFDDVERRDGFLWLFKSGDVSRAELDHFIRHTPANSEAAAAARMLAADDDLWDQIAGSDGKISFEDLEDFAANDTTATTPDMNAADLAPTVAATIPASELPDTIESQRAALEQVSAAYASIDPDGNGIERSELQRTINSTGASQELRAAAQFLLNQFDTVAGADGRISSSALHVAATRFGLAPTKTLEIIKANLPSFADGGSFDLARLKQVAADPEANPELRAAASVLVHDAALFGRVDNAAQGGRRDGRITSADLEAAISVGDMSDNRSAELIAFSFSSIKKATDKAGDVDGISAEDLEHISENSESPELRAAALHALRSGLFDRIRRFAFERGSQNGLVTNDDLREFMRASPLSTTPVGQPRPLPTSNLAQRPQPGNSSQLSGAGRRQPAADTNALYREIDSVLTDPGLSVEDKVAFFLMLICKYMDKQIEAQMKYIQQLQLAYAQQQETKRQEGLARINGGDDATSAAGAGETEGAGGTQVYGDVNAQTIDTEVMKLKRLVDKRGQLFDIMRQIIDKYNQTAKGIIDTIGR